MKHIVIGICTQNRLELLGQSLISLSKLKQIESVNISLILVENDLANNSEIVLTRLKEQLSLFDNIYYFLETKIGIPYARNRVLKEAIELEANYLAFFDDDTIVDSNWLATLYQIMQMTDADVVTGPQIPIYEDKIPKWVVKSKLFQERRLEELSSTCWAATHNLFLNLTFITQNQLSFNKALKNAGGEDELLTRTITKMGSKIIWTNRAIVYEPVMVTRATKTWLIKRHFRLGSCGTLIEKCLHGKVKGNLISLAKAIKYFLLFPITIIRIFILRDRMFIHASCHLSKSVGFLLGISGINYQEYKNRIGK